MYSAVSVGYVSTSMDSDNSDEHRQHQQPQQPQQQQQQLALATKQLIESNPPLPYQTRPQSSHQLSLSYSPFTRPSSFLPQQHPPPSQRPLLHIDPHPLHSHHPHHHHPHHQLAPLIPAPPSLNPPSSSSTTTPTQPSNSPATVNPGANASSKPSLLTPHQKKQNHIQSEQKRRANIKRGYEALCETIPALREAIRQEEELANALKNGSGNGARKRSRTGSLAGDRDPSAGASGNGGGDRIDGRAGPKSENVVLQKTIDHIRSQLDERQRLKLRLERARNALPSSHPLVDGPNKSNPDPVVPWERPWYGGKNDEEGSDEE